MLLLNSTVLKENFTGVPEGWAPILVECSETSPSPFSSDFQHVALKESCSSIIKALSIFFCNIF